MNKNYPLLENIANLLKKEKYIFEYEFYIVNNTLHVLINEDIYTQSLYYEYFLDNSNYISKDTSEDLKDNTEIILYREYLKEKCLCSCIRFNIHKYDSSKSKYYYIGILLYRCLTVLLIFGRKRRNVQIFWPENVIIMKKL